jgi:hypothetical protein
MQFLMTLTIGHTSAPPQALETAMTLIKLVDDETAAGTIVCQGDSLQARKADYVPFPKAS